MASPTQWTWVWVSSGTWWWTGRWHAVVHGIAKSQIDWATEMTVQWVSLKTPIRLSTQAVLILPQGEVEGCLPTWSVLTQRWVVRSTSLEPHGEGTLSSLVNLYQLGSGWGHTFCLCDIFCRWCVTSVFFCQKTQASVWMGLYLSAPIIFLVSVLLQKQVLNTWDKTNL